jgi:hypothetical protein
MVKDALRPIRRDFENRPISMQLHQFATIDGPQQAGAAMVQERTMAAAAKQG